ncbi:MAG: Trm112 family protein [Nanoarchaeota archaeon]|nr:Trm112 family protein [Nanoarchaeota archaeon]
MKTLSKELLEALACPKCKGGLEYNKQKNELLCKKCRKAYKVQDGTPVLLA